MGPSRIRTYYIYEVPGHKNGATVNWNKRSKWNFEKFGIMPILIETMEGPNTPDMWKVVGDREWELADANGYKRGTHYLEIQLKVTREAQSKGGQANDIDHLKEISRLGGQAGGKKGGSVTGNKKVKCPHCNMVSNPGNITQHIKAKH
jgi:hypothetical protein